MRRETGRKKETRERERGKGDEMSVRITGVSQSRGWAAWSGPPAVMAAGSKQSKTPGTVAREGDPLYKGGPSPSVQLKGRSRVWGIFLAIFGLYSTHSQPTNGPPA